VASPGEGLDPLGPVVHLRVDVGQLTLQPLHSRLRINTEVLVHNNTEVFVYNNNSASGHRRGKNFIIKLNCTQ
jgi:hypothetical protein